MVRPNDGCWGIGVQPPAPRSEGRLVPGARRDLTREANLLPLQASSPEQIGNLKVFAERHSGRPEVGEFWTRGLPPPPSVPKGKAPAPNRSDPGAVSSARWAGGLMSARGVIRLNAQGGRLVPTQPRAKKLRGQGRNNEGQRSSLYRAKSPNAGGRRLRIPRALQLP